MAFTKKEKEQDQDQYAPKVVVFETIAKNDQSHKMVSIDTIFCPEKKTVRKIMLLNGASTIFVDEMKEFELTLPKVDLIFMDRKLEVDIVEDLKIKFLRLSDQNADKEKRMPNRKPPVFREIKPLADVKAKLDKLALQNKAESLATSCDESEMLPFAHVIGINVDQNIDFVRAEFIEVARIRPDYFLKYFDNPKNLKQYQINIALNKDVIRIDGGVAKWKEGLKKIVDVPADKDPKSFLADYAGTDDGKAFYEALKKLI